MSKYSDVNNHESVKQRLSSAFATVEECINADTDESYVSTENVASKVRTTSRGNALMQCTDGSAISEIDLLIRGPGSYITRKQHGTDSYK
jgi:hypothetical protein